MTAGDDSEALVLRQPEIEPFDRGGGVRTLPYVGAWNSASTTLTTGTTAFAVGTALPRHTHNVEETVLVLSGEAEVDVGDETTELVAGDATWVPAGVPHRFANRGASPMVIYWVYGGRYVTRTLCDTGETFEHLSPNDRGGHRKGDEPNGVES